MIMKPWHSVVVLSALMLAPLPRAQFVQWEIEKRQFTRDLHRRSEKSTFEEIITNQRGRGGYFASVTVGSPGQDLVMQLDTASSDSWVPYSGAPICEGLTSGCSMGSCRSTDWLNSSFGSTR